MRDWRDCNGVLRTVRSSSDIGLDAICSTIRSLKRDAYKCATATGRQVKTCGEDARGKGARCMGKDQASKSNSISRLTTAQSQLTNWRSVQTRASTRTRCEKSVWALDFALPRERTRGSVGWAGKKGKGRDDRMARGKGEEGVLSGEEAEESRERVRMRTSADDAKYRAGGAECAAAHLS